MPRSIWTGAISFGLVNVPIKMYTAVRKQDVRFHQLHVKDGSRIQQKRVCAEEGVEVPWEEIAKGYEVGKDRYVMIEPEELEALDPESTHTIDIEDFVDLVDIDPLYFDSSYYLVPDKRGAKAYRLLLEAMEESKKVGIARFVMRTKQYLAALRPKGDVLVLSTMNFADEVMTEDELDDLPGKTKIDQRELDIAERLIDSLSTSFKPEKYHDDYREQVEKLIDRKAKGEEIVAPAATAKPAPVVDLMAALEASLAKVKEGGGASKSSTSTKATKASKSTKKASKARKSTKKAARKAS